MRWRLSLATTTQREPLLRYYKNPDCKHKSRSECVSLSQKMEGPHCCQPWSTPRTCSTSPPFSMWNYHLTWRNWSCLTLILNSSERDPKTKSAVVIFHCQDGHNWALQTVQPVLSNWNNWWVTEEWGIKVNVSLANIVADLFMMTNNLQLSDIHQDDTCSREGGVITAKINVCFKQGWETSSPHTTSTWQKPT